MVVPGGWGAVRLAVRPVTVSAVLMMLKARALEVPPPGAGVKTVTCGVPAVTRSVAGMLAVSWVALTNVVVRLPPFHCTTDAGTKPLPVTVRVKAGSPAERVVGEMLVSVGVGLLTLSVAAPEVPPPGAGVETLTLFGPTGAMSAARMVAVSWVVLTKHV